MWIVGFAGLLIVTAVLQPYLVPADLPEAFVTWFFVLNIGMVIAITFGLLYYFVGRNFFQQRADICCPTSCPRRFRRS